MPSSVDDTLVALWWLSERELEMHARRARCERRTRVLAAATVLLRERRRMMRQRGADDANGRGWVHEQLRSETRQSMVPQVEAEERGLCAEFAAQKRRRQEVAATRAATRAAMRWTAMRSPPSAEAAAAAVVEDHQLMER